jgi:FKBP-type peptidyl-prolyl cis-trans isomerase FkpA
MGNLTKTGSGLEYEDVVIGTGTEAKAGMQISAHYTGTLIDGSVFDSSVQRKEPFTFKLGAGQVIKGWDEGILGMKVGGKRRLVIPAALAYGTRGHPPVIPPNATLNFDIELLDAK